MKFLKDHEGQKTLAKQADITMTAFETSLETDPLFKKVTRKFDEMNSGNLLSSTLSINSNLLIQLDSGTLPNSHDVIEQQPGNQELSKDFTHVANSLFTASNLYHTVTSDKFICQHYEDWMHRVYGSSSAQTQLQQSFEPIGLLHEELFDPEQSFGHVVDEDMG